MRIAERLVAQLVASAGEAAPFECCGMIGCRDGEAVEVYPARNVAENPTMAYEMDGLDQFELSRAIQDAGLTLGAIYHSHPRSPAFPSQADIRLATYPDAVYVIVGLASAAAPEVRGYRIRDGQIASEPLLA